MMRGFRREERVLSRDQGEATSGSVLRPTSIRIGLRELRADAGMHAWVRESLLNGTLLQSPEAFTGFVEAWAGDERPSELESLWIVRVFLQFIDWPAADEATELELLRRFVTFPNG